MPEFEEEINPAIDHVVDDKKVENKDIVNITANERERYALKRGRIPVQKKNVSLSMSNVGEIDANAVRNDAIGFGANKSVKNNIQKSTSVVEKNDNHKKNGKGQCCKKSMIKPSGQNACMEHEKNKCQGGVLVRCLRKLFGFLGFCKCKCKNQPQPEKTVRSYRRRTNNQRRRRPQGNVR